MAKKKKLVPTEPSKAYLVSFGDTMTALLAFFIVLNSLAKEQTGANMYAGTGSFSRAFTGSGVPGGMPGKRSSELIKKAGPKPIYALPENEKSDEKAGPDKVERQERVIEREKENFQNFLEQIASERLLEKLPAVTNQTAFDSFQPALKKNGTIDDDALQLLSESIARVRKPGTRLEIIIWATMPSKRNLDTKLVEAKQLQNQVNKTFWLDAATQSRVLYRAKPWLFSDIKRPKFTIVYSDIETGRIGQEKDRNANTKVKRVES